MISKTLLIACGSFLLFCGGASVQQKPTIEVSSATYGLNSSKSWVGERNRVHKIGLRREEELHLRRQKRRKRNR
jgi:hypothetical protein